MHQKGLESLFKFYSSQDKKEINFKLNQNLQRISFNEFIKFGIKTNVQPYIISNEDMVLIFRVLTKERNENLTQKEIDEIGLGENSLTLEYFKKALIRIAILG